MGKQGVKKLMATKKNFTPRNTPTPPSREEQRRKAALYGMTIKEVNALEEKLQKEYEEHQKRMLPYIIRKDKYHAALAKLSEDDLSRLSQVKWHVKKMFFLAVRRNNKSFKAIARSARYGYACFGTTPEDVDPLGLFDKCYTVSTLGGLPVINFEDHNLHIDLIEDGGFQLSIYAINIKGEQVMITSIKDIFDLFKIS